jgi:pimeloyl-ACP methyl ester carboxylesterase
MSTPVREKLKSEPNEFRITPIERTSSGFLKYNINLPLHPSVTIINQLKATGAEFPLDRVQLTVWSESDLTEIHSIEDMRETLEKSNTSSYPIMLLNGLLSNSNQFDRTGTSFIRKLTDMIRSDGKHQGFQPLYIGMSGLGFSGSEINMIQNPGQLDVGVRRYQTVLQAVLDELHFPESHGALIGHSAGGAVVLEHEHNTTNDMRAKVALCPAIHLEKATQFDYIDKLLRLQEGTVYPIKALRKWTSEEVVRYLLGISFTIPKHKLPIAIQEQINMHVEELEKHRDATHLKLKELNKPLQRGSNTVMSTLSIIAEDDILTPPEQIREGFPDEFTGFLTIPNSKTNDNSANHDDIFIKEEVQTLVLPYIASYLINRRIDYPRAKEQGLI